MVILDDIPQPSQPTPPLCHHDVMLKAFRELKRYDRNVSHSDLLLTRFEDAWRARDADKLMVLLTCALADSHPDSHLTSGW